MPANANLTVGRIDDLLRSMQDLDCRIWTPRSRRHVGQLAWSARSALPEDRPMGPVGLWRVAGEVVAWGWAESASSLELAIDPRHPALARAVIDWFLDTDLVSPECTVMESDRSTREALEVRGFVSDPAAPWFSHHVLELAWLPPPRNVPGYTFRHIEPGEHEARAACHRGSWSDFGPSRVSGAAYERLAATWPYRRDLDWVAVSDDGEMVASCLVWFDEVNGVGLIEPVGCIPAHRRRGLAAAVSLAALHALHGLGAAMALVNPRGDAAYPAPGLLYRSIGFHPVDRTITYTRPGKG